MQPATWIPRRLYHLCSLEMVQIKKTFLCAKRAHDLVVDQIADLFRTTHKVKTQQVTKSPGQWCGDIELSGYLVNVRLSDMSGLGSNPANREIVSSSEASEHPKKKFLDFF